MTGIGDFLALLARRDPVLLLLGAIVVLLSAAAVGFAVIALWLRARNTRRARQWARIEMELEAGLLDVMDGSEPPAALLEHLRRRDERPFVELVSRYARRVRGAERERLSQLAASLLPRIAVRLTHRHPAVRARAIQTITLLGLDRYAARIVAALDDPSPLVRMAAARALARREHPQFAAELLARLEHFQHWHGGFLATMFAAIGPDAAPALTATLADAKRPPAVRAVAAEALRMLNHLPAADPAAAALTQTGERDLLASALRLLRQVGRPEHLPAIRACASGADPLVRAQALSALGALETPDALAAYATALDDPSPWVALHAARALRQLPGQAALRRLAASDAPRRTLALQVLAEAGA